MKDTMLMADAYTRVNGAGLLAYIQQRSLDL